jgi:hypothetical protein
LLHKHVKDFFFQKHKNLDFWCSFKGSGANSHSFQGG